MSHDDTAFFKSDHQVGWCASDSSLVGILVENDYYFDLLLQRLDWILGARYHMENSASEEPTFLISSVRIPPMGIRLTTHMLTTVKSSLLTKPNLDWFWNLESLG